MINKYIAFKLINDQYLPIETIKPKRLDMRVTVQQQPEGYEIIKAADGSWGWESVLAPECHSSGGFATEAEAIKHCRTSNNMAKDDWR